MTINNQEILRMLESPNPNKEVNDAIKDRQDLIKKIMDVQNPGETKDLITIARDFKELMNLDENELTLRYLSKKYPDFKFKLEDGDIHAELRSYLGKTLTELPAGLKELNIWDCPNLGSLPSLPPSLEVLHLNCKNIEVLPELPPGLEVLHLNCKNIEVLPELPPGLKDLSIWDCPNLGSLPSLPPSLEVLHLNCKNIEVLPEFPSSLKDLEINNCPNLEALPEFPPFLKGLKIEYCPNLEAIPEFPSSLKDLCIWDCENLEAIPEFPLGLEFLSIICCDNLNQENLDRIKEFNKKQS